ncbi:hypothetical protein DVH05_013248 [Phytophthora capsici]|nr:hypothetical protein DVH05_013248 [Phytophthora capsici]
MSFLQDEDDMRAFEATLNFVEEYATESSDIPSLVDSSDASSSLAFRLSDALPSELLADDTSSTSLTVPLTMAEQHFNPTETHFHVGTSRIPDTKQRKTNRRPQANPNRVRNELRFELAYLHEKVAQLEQELKALQVKPRVEMLGEKPHSQLSSSPQVICAWKGVAGRQRQRKEDAERENSRLRIIVERQRKVAVDLSQLLRKRVSEMPGIGTF